MRTPGRRTGTTTIEERLREAREFALEHPRLAGDARVVAIVWWEAGAEAPGWTVEIYQDHKRVAAVPLSSVARLKGSGGRSLPTEDLRSGAALGVRDLTGHTPHVIVLREEEPAPLRDHERAPEPGGSVPEPGATVKTVVRQADQRPAGPPDTPRGPGG